MKITAVPSTRELECEANRLLRRAGFYQHQTPGQAAFERRLISIPTGGQPRVGKARR